MFLNRLSDSNKEAFVELAYKLAYVNRDFPTVQQKLLGRYKEECGVHFIPNTSTKEELIAHFGKEDEAIKRIVYYEIYMLLISDEKIDQDEMKALETMRSAFNISEEEAVTIQDTGVLVKESSQKLRDLLCIS